MNGRLEPADDPAHAAVRGTVSHINRSFRSHAGRVELIAVVDDQVTVRFGGACTGCVCRPQCLVATVEPALLRMDGIARVHAVGVRIDAGTRDQLSLFLSASYPAGAE